MNVGIGLPNAVPGTPARRLVDWARAAEVASFSSIAVVDRLNYACHEPLSTLAAAAAVTDRIALATTVIIGPLRNTALLASEAATVDAISGGRLTLGLAVGARRDDYATAEVPHADRGERLTSQLVALRSAWAEHSVGVRPATEHGPPLLVGGTSDRAFARAARHADGYVHGGGPPRTFARAAESANRAWEDAGRPGRPRLWAQGYFALGDDEVVAAGRSYMLDYYGFTGPFAQRIAEGLLTTPQDVNQFVRGYAEAGCDELVLFPAVADLAQVERLAEVVAGG